MWFYSEFDTLKRRTRFHSGKGKQMIKRLVVCLDGTWNSPDQGKENPTNVVKIMRAIRSADDAGVPQIAFYDAGVGTDGSKFSRAVAGTVGRGLDQNVKDGYRFLANNWRAGDEVYLFGFSRGAFTARSLCGFLTAIGLLRKSKMHRMREAWEVYQTEPKQRDPAHLASLRADAETEVPVRCLGVWDTVGALGVPGELLQGFNKEYQFHDTELCGLVEHAFHALAIDEKRGPFGPTLWQGKKGKTPEQKTVEQVWFPGVHSNVGGSYDDAGLSDVTLAWMIQRVQDVSDLTFDAACVHGHIDPNPLGEIYESRSALYTTSRLYPYQRLIGQNDVDGSWLRRWVERRNRPDDGCEFVNEMIHWSAVERFGKEAKENGEVRRYQPANLAAALENRNVPIIEKRELVIQPSRQMLPAAE